MSSPFLSLSLMLSFSLPLSPSQSLSSSLSITNATKPSTTRLRTLTKSSPTFTAPPLATPPSRASSLRCHNHLTDEPHSATASCRDHRPSSPPPSSLSSTSHPHRPPPPAPSLSPPRAPNSSALIPTCRRLQPLSPPQLLLELCPRTPELLLLQPDADQPSVLAQFLPLASPSTPPVPASGHYSPSLSPSRRPPHLPHSQPRPNPAAPYSSATIETAATSDRRPAASPPNTLCP